MRILLLFLLCLANAAELNKQEVALRTVDFYNREERVDVMFSFVAPYLGEINQESNKEYTTITFPYARSYENYQSDIGTFGIDSIKITQVDDAVVVIILGGANLRIQAAKILDGYGLRLRITQKPDDALGKLKDTLNDLQLKE